MQAQIHDQLQQQMEQIICMTSKITLTSATRDQDRRIHQAFNQTSVSQSPPASRLSSSHPSGCADCRWSPLHHQSFSRGVPVHCGQSACGINCGGRCHKALKSSLPATHQGLVHFPLRMPRIVGQYDLIWLQFATVDAVRAKLWSRELTVDDVQPDGYTPLHVSTSLQWNCVTVQTYTNGQSQVVTARLSVDGSETALSIVALLTEHSAPAEREWNGL